MVDAALNIAAEQVIEHSAYGALLERGRQPRARSRRRRTSTRPRARRRRSRRLVGGDRGRRPTSSGRRCARAVGDPTWAADPRLATVGRSSARTTTGSTPSCRQWCRARSADEIVELLWDAGVPVGKVDAAAPAARAARSCELAQLLRGGRPPGGGTRSLQHAADALLARARTAGTPRHAPLLGEHNAELLAELGLSAAEIAALEADGGIIGSARSHRRRAH